MAVGVLYLTGRECDSGSSIDFQVTEIKEWAAAYMPAALSRNRKVWYVMAGKKRTVYAVTLVELREKEKQIERDLQDGIDSSKGDMTLNQLFQIYMETKSDLRESTRYNYLAVWKNAIEDTSLGNMKISQIK